MTYLNHQRYNDIKERRTKEPVVLSAYESTSPTKAASTPVVINATNERIDTKKTMKAPTNSSRIANHRFTEILGR
jgi:hypothetical protein